jgi:lysosomal-associated membrane protein 1/2
MFDSLTSITLEFFLNEKNETSLKKVYGSITVKNNPKYFPNCSTNVGSILVFNANESLFVANRASSYRCNSKTKIDNFKTDGNLTLKSIDLENLRVQPFIDNSIIFHDYAPEKVCTMDYFKSSNLIPIIVGVCLALLVIVVLVAYLIGRRRNRNGYQSV